MDYVFNFTTREEYLAWRAQWRQDYQMISEDIRALKREMADKRLEVQDIPSQQSNLHYQRMRANSLMSERTAATRFKDNQIAALVAVAA